MSNFFVNSFFPYSIKQWDQLDPELRKEHDFAVFKAKLKETIKPSKFKHFNVGYKYPNQLHTQLRVGRSSLNSHLYPIGLSNTKSCPCGFANESVEHFLLDCIFYQNIRGQLYQKLGGLLEMKLSTYSKKDLVQIMLCGEKPHLPEKFYHNNVSKINISSIKTNGFFEMLTLCDNLPFMWDTTKTNTAPKA